MDDISKILSRNIKNLREKLDLNQKELASKAKVSLVQMNRIEQGKIWPSLQTIRKISKALQVEDAVLFQTNIEHQKPSIKDALDVINEVCLKKFRPDKEEKREDCRERERIRDNVPEDSR